MRLSGGNRKKKLGCEEVEDREKFFIFSFVSFKVKEEKSFATRSWFLKDTFIYQKYCIRLLLKN